MRTGLRCALASVLVLTSTLAHAAPSTKEACISAFDQAQRERRTGHLRASREQLLLCTREECPSVIRADCAGVLRQTEAAQPTIVVKAADAKGGDLTDVTVELNGQPLVTSLDGRAITIDPGKLSLVFKRPPWEPVTVDVVIAEGEKGRIVRATLGPPLPKERPVTAPAPSTTKTTRSIAGWVVPLGLGVVSLGAFAIGGVTRLNLGSEVDDKKTGPNACAPFCSQADRDRLSGDLVLANVMLGVGVGALALAVGSWFVLGPRHSATGQGTSGAESSASHTIATLLTGQPIRWP